ncbi:hypothetical protein H310_01085 [Aphanomyces invadans]|uniref:Peptidase C45 hydrolase domain-containing protein n=1 Tax=Aphanomyces invadans TaxID=157072 RepID=A0A024URP7_9STRA|nr:hypothetical protein H310_01085 [Aphanomyces invadans]ETW08522.1 hypothetical protein H310_01085 [Aphanomyces invadans]|eukprot:XP_008862327.1 hypothetical protein H310_01085 [Aphanomyces invadans]
MGSMLRALVLPVLLAGLSADAAPARVSVDTSLELPWFKYEGDSHFEFGELLGKQFRDAISTRLRLSSQLHTVLLPFYNTPLGKTTYDKYLATHNKTFPSYVEELEGISAGSGEPFSTLFLINLIEEFGQSIPRPNAFQCQLHCSDLVLHTSNLCVVGHNEDSGAGDVNHTALVTAKIKGEPWFTAYTYLGDLPTGAFGANEHGVAFSLNYVEPLDIDVGGLGRGFVSRDVLGSTSLDDAIARITRPGQASGHNIQIMHIPSSRVFNIEVASFNRSNVREILVGDPPFFHTNQYQSMLIRQPASPSSYHRLRRYSHVVPPTSVSTTLALLGDQGDKSYPIFHDDKSHVNGELSNWTLITALFDVKNGVLYLLHPRVNPSQARVAMVVDLFDVQRVTLLHTAPEQGTAQANMLAAKPRS